MAKRPKGPVTREVVRARIEGAFADTGTVYSMHLFEEEVIDLACGRVPRAIRTLARDQLTWPTSPNPAERLKKRGWKR